MKNIQVHAFRVVAFAKKNPLVFVALIALISVATMGPLKVVR